VWRAISSASKTLSKTAVVRPGHGVARLEPKNIQAENNKNSHTQKNQAARGTLEDSAVLHPPRLASNRGGLSDRLLIL
jgi:hypothetical protein